MIENKPVNDKDVKPGDVVIARSKCEWEGESGPPFWVFVAEFDEYQRDGLGNQMGFWPAVTHDFFVVGSGYATISSSAAVRIMEALND